MSIEQLRDAENGTEDMKNPLLLKKDQEKLRHYEDSDTEQTKDHNNGSIAMVLFSTFVAVCGSFEFGSCVSCSLAVDLHLVEMKGRFP